MTIREAAEQILGSASYDGALPLAWCEQMKETTGIWPYAFVWAYDSQAGMSGRPCALTPDANQQLAEYNAARGCSYPLTENPIKEK